MRRAAKRPRVLVIAGLEPEGRAGLLADAWAVRRAGGVPVCVASAITAQGIETFAVESVSARTVVAQVDAALERGRVDAVKIGLVADTWVLRALERKLPELRVPLVIDPVVESSRGQLLSDVPVSDLTAFPGAILTPNLPEAAWLTDTDVATTQEEVDAQGDALLSQGVHVVIIKGGHRTRIVDSVYFQRPPPGSPERVLLPARKLRRPAHVRGTGCRYASALATRLGAGDSLVDAASTAQRIVRAYIAAPEA